MNPTNINFQLLSAYALTHKPEQAHYRCLVSQDGFEVKAGAYLHAMGRYEDHVWRFVSNPHNLYMPWSNVDEAHRFQEGIVKCLDRHNYTQSVISLADTVDFMMAELNRVLPRLESKMRIVASDRMDGLAKIKQWLG